MREMKNSGIEWIGEIPKNWNISKMKYIVNCLDGQRRPVDASHRTSGKYPYWGAGSIQDYVDNYIFNDNLILLGEDGAPFFDPNRQVAFCVSGKIWVNNHIHVLKEKNGWDRRYVMYSLNSVDYKQYINGSILNKLTQGNMNNIVICAPSTQEQRKIADFLDSKCSNIDALISNIESQIDILEQYKRSVITEVVTKGLNPDVKMKDSGVKWIGEIPKAWGLSKIRDLYSLRVEKVSDKDYMSLSVTMQGILPQLENVAKTNDEDNRKLVKTGDFVINSRSDRRGSCGISEYDGSVSLINTVLCPKDNMNSEYYNWLFHSTAFSDEFYRRGHGIVDDLWTTAWQDMKKITIPVPSLSEQKQIADYLDEKCSNIDAILEGRKAELATLKEYKKSLIYEYVTGKKEVPTP